jgi:hypothetical protein
MFDGKILAADTPENLQHRMAGSSQVIAEIAAPAEALRECFSQMPEIEQFDVSAGDGGFQRCKLTPRDGLDLRPVVFALARDRGWVVRELTRHRHSLEDIYEQITRPGEEEENE